MLQNNDLEVLPPTTAAGWEIEEGSAAQYADFSAHSGANGFWVRAYEGFPNPVNASVTQTVAGEAGKTYRFTGWSYFEKAYSGGVTVLDPDSPWGATNSTTQTMFEMAFLNAVAMCSVRRLLSTCARCNKNDATWRQHALSGVAPAGTASVRVGVNVIDMYQNVDKPFQTANFDDFSLTTTHPCDLNADGAIDAADAGIMFGDWGGPIPLRQPIRNSDGFVDAADAESCLKRGRAIQRHPPQKPLRPNTIQKPANSKSLQPAPSMCSCKATPANWSPSFRPPRFPLDC